MLCVLRVNDRLRLVFALTVIGKCKPVGVGVGWGKKTQSLITFILINLSNSICRKEKENAATNLKHILKQ